jgi:type IV secretion system protein VirB4
MRTEQDITEAFPVFAPFGDRMVITKRGTLLAAVAVEGADFDALTRGDLSHVALVAAQIAEQLPYGASITQYYIHLDKVPVRIRDRENPLIHAVSKARESFLNERGLARSFLYHVYEFADAGAATTSLWGDVRDSLAGGLFEPRRREKLLTRLRNPSSPIFSREGMNHLAKNAADALDKIVGLWGKLGDARLIERSEFWSLLRYLATFDPAHLAEDRRGKLVMPDDEIDIQLPAGDIETIDIRGNPFLKLHGDVARYARIGSVTGVPADPLGWLTIGADAPLRQKGDYVLVHHFEPLSELARTAKFAAARNAIERTRINLVNIIKGETTDTSEERRPKHKEKLAAIEAADARHDRWGTAFTTLVVPHEDPAAVSALVRSFNASLTNRSLSLVWENVGLPFAFRSIQPGGAVASKRRSTVASSRHGVMSLALKSRIGQPVVADLGGEESAFIFETSTGEPFHFSPYVNGRAFSIGVGPVRSGKTYLMNTVASHFLKYGGFIRSVDIDPGGKCVCDVFSEGGRGYLALGEAGGLNPFVSQQGVDDLAFATYLAQQMQLLLQANDTGDAQHLDRDEQKDVDRSIRAVMQMPAEMRSMPRLFEHLNHNTRRKFERWMSRGLYDGIVNADVDAIGTLDKSISTWNLGRFRDTPPVLKPVLFDLFYRVTRSFEDPAYQTIPKLLQIDEAHHALSIPYFRDYLVRKVRTWGKWGAGITLWSQSPTEYARIEDWSAIRSAAGSFFFMADRHMDAEQYRSTFHLTDGDIAAIQQLVPRRQVYLIQPELDVRKTLTLRVDPTQHVINTSHPQEAAIRDRLIREYGLTDGIARAAVEIAELGTSQLEGQAA